MDVAPAYQLHRQHFFPTLGQQSIREVSGDLHQAHQAEAQLKNVSLQHLRQLHLENCGITIDKHYLKQSLPILPEPEQRSKTLPSFFSWRARMLLMREFSYSGSMALSLFENV